MLNEGLNDYYRLMMATSVSRLCGMARSNLCSQCAAAWKAGHYTQAEDTSWAGKQLPRQNLTQPTVNLSSFSGRIWECEQGPSVWPWISSNHSKSFLTILSLKKEEEKMANQYVHKNWMFDYPASLMFIVSGSKSHTSDHCQLYEWKLQVHTLAAFLWDSSFFISDKLRWWTSRCLCCSCILTEMASFSSCSWKK